MNDVEYPTKLGIRFTPTQTNQRLNAEINEKENILSMCVCVCMSVNVCMCVHMSVNVCMCACIRMSVNVYMCACMSVNVCFSHEMCIVYVHVS